MGKDKKLDRILMLIPIGLDRHLLLLKEISLISILVEFVPHVVGISK